MTTPLVHSIATEASKSIGDITQSPEQGYEAFGTRSRLRVQSCPPDPTVYGQAFWDVQLEVIAYHLIPHRPYDSYIHGDSFRIDTDSVGHPVFFELQWDGRRHSIVESLQPPVAIGGSIRLLDLRIRYHELSVLSTSCHSITYVELDRARPSRHVSFGSGMILSVSEDNYLCGLWIIKAIRDPVGSALQSQWRSKAWRSIRRRWLESEPRDSAAMISPISSPKVC